MRLSFDDEDEDAYFATRDALLDEIVDSLSPAGRGAPDPEEVAGAISVLLDWRWNYSTGQLDQWSLGDVDEFLLDWLPREYSALPRPAPRCARRWPTSSSTWGRETACGAAPTTPRGSSPGPTS